MGQWLCACGNRMSDTCSPQDNEYVAYLSKTWDGLKSVDDSEFVNSTINVYVCNKCGRLTVFLPNATKGLTYKPDD